MTANTSPTGIRYGYVSAQDLYPDLVWELMIGAGATQFVNHSEVAAQKQDEAEQRSGWEDELEAKTVKSQEEGTDIVHDDFEFQAPADGYEIYEPVVEGIKDGITYMSSWLGGALHFFISDSPFVTTAANRASPCVPNAGILHHPNGRDGDVTCYDVHPEWWEDYGPTGLNLGEDA